MSVVGFPVLWSFPSDTAKQRWGDDIVGRYGCAGGKTELWEPTAKECPMCHGVLQRPAVFSGRQGRCVAKDGNSLAIDVLPEGMQVFRCATCLVAFYSPALEKPA